MHDFTRETIDLEAIGARLRRMSDEELIRYGRAAANLARPFYGRAPRETWIVQRDEARAEWRRRHPKSGDGTQ